MPIHDWTRVEAGIFHDFHHAWIEQIKRLLNSGVLPPDHYAMAEQHTSHFGPDVLTLQSRSLSDHMQDEQEPLGNGACSIVAVRHVNGDRLVTIVEIVSPGNKSSRAVLSRFVDKAVDLLNQDIQLLILDLFPPTRRDPNGIHGAI